MGLILFQSRFKENLNRKVSKEHFPFLEIEMGFRWTQSFFWPVAHTRNLLLKKKNRSCNA